MPTSKIVTTPVRFSYLHAREPKINSRGDESYGAMLVFSKKDKALLKMVEDALEAAFKEDKENKNVLKVKGDKLPSNIATTFYDGDEQRPDDPVVEGCYYINASSNRKIEVLDRDRNTITDPDEIYSGMYGRALLQFKAYIADGKKGIACYLNGIQKTKNAERLDGISDPSKAFEDDFDEFEDDGYEAPSKTKKVIDEDEWDNL